MSKNTRYERDAFGFSLAGINVIKGFSVATVVADDVINKALDEKMRKIPDDQPDTERELTSFWKRIGIQRRSAKKAA